MHNRLSLCPNLEAVLKVVVFLEEHGIVYDDLRCGDPEIYDAIIHCLCRLKKATDQLILCIYPRSHLLK